MKKQARRAPDMKRFYAVIVVVLLVGAAVLAYTLKSGAPSVVTLDPNLPPATAEGYVMGSPDAKIEIVEFGDFECGVCGRFGILTAPDVKKRLVETGIARFRFYDFPLEQHPNALSAHVAAGCAADQNRFWEMHDRLFQGEYEWTTPVTNNPKKVLKRYASELNLDVDTWEECYDERKPLPRIIANRDEGLRLGVHSTPTFRIGSKLIPGLLSYDEVRAHVDSALADTVTAGGSL